MALGPVAALFLVALCVFGLPTRHRREFVAPRRTAACAGAPVREGPRWSRASRAAFQADDGPAVCLDAESYNCWAASHGASFPKIEVRAGQAGLWGAVAAAPMEPLEVVASVPMAMALAVDAGPEWEARLTEQALLARFRRMRSPPHPWVAGWHRGGWGTDLTDLIPRDRANVVGGSLLTTGSDNDVEIYRKFGLPCHPVLDRAARALEAWTGCSRAAARSALRSRGTAFRACRDELEGVVELSVLRAGELPGQFLSQREQRVFQVSRYFSLALARATTLAPSEYTPAGLVAVVPFHEVLEHCGAIGENTKLVLDAEGLKLVAARRIGKGEPLTRDYAASPRVAEVPSPPNTPTGGSVTRPPGEDDIALQMLLQSNIRPDCTGGDSKTGGAWSFLLLAAWLCCLAAMRAAAPRPAALAARGGAARAGPDMSRGRWLAKHGEAGIRCGAAGVRLGGMPAPPQVPRGAAASANAPPPAAAPRPGADPLDDALDELLASAKAHLQRLDEVTSRLPPREPGSGGACAQRKARGAGARQQGFGGAGFWKPRCDAHLWAGAGECCSRPSSAGSDMDSMASSGEDSDDARGGDAAAWEFLRAASGAEPQGRQFVPPEGLFSSGATAAAGPAGATPRPRGGSGHAQGAAEAPPAAAAARPSRAQRPPRPPPTEAGGGSAGCGASVGRGGQAGFRFGADPSCCSGGDAGRALEYPEADIAAALASAKASGPEAQRRVLKQLLLRWHPDKAARGGDAAAGNAALEEATRAFRFLMRERERLGL
ncbi:unnamed protein product [Prorocentrum cordatum]|uniref:J domain-containing protein n=1 Tax=Prorocentrum cordatum TaxID=2364126 RepID=A0ABN9XDF7_9DINO|nr:unnamed protein product [Polarella glacialis]